MADALLLVLDLALALGACLRLTRFLVADDLPGEWWIKAPLRDSAIRHADPAGDFTDYGWRGRVLQGLGCPYCVSVWMAAATTLSLFLAGGPGDAADWWRWVAGFLTLAWVTGHVAARAGDTED